MEPLTWTGAIGAVLNPIFGLCVAALLVFWVASFVVSLVVTEERAQANADGTMVARRGLPGLLSNLVWITFLLLVALCAIYLLAGIVTPYGMAGILGEVGQRLLPVWIALLVTFVVSIRFKRRLGLYGKLFDSPIGMVGFALVMFWVFAALFADLIATHDMLSQRCLA